MLKRLGIPVFALAAALASITPAVARDRDDHRGVERHETSRRSDDRWESRDRYRGNSAWSFGYYSAPAPVPAPVASGYYDRYGNWHPYGYAPAYGASVSGRYGR